MDEDLVDANCAANLPRLGVEASARPEGEREPKAYDDDEIRTIWAAATTLDVSVRAIYQLGLLTGQRPAEIANLEWSEIDGAWWTIPGRRTKNGRDHRVYLSATTRQLLADVPRISGEGHVFAGTRGKKQLARANRHVFADVRLKDKPRHALRDTVATGLARCGVAVETIARVLNLSYGPRVTAGYNAYRYDAEQQHALETWEHRLKATLDETEPGRVVRFCR